ncbi:calcium/sodium antiporter [Pelagibacterium xiamenense]|uniref:calcium/sodium antiporter n=1 Tax=Pelagibacterium xiamenense TaxID=2901140 RepID=UPI001E29904F|nr:calcium/sodium antiporter [Pelagibacterium xiamenense]MCD7060087.1 calcium/sodium antiporter [Pelagibacterium xiamenense]
MVYVFLILGLVLLVAGGESFVRGSVAIARRLGMSPLLIGLTLMGFGTSLPEMVTSVQAALDGAPGIAMGNVVGSNIANILLILGVAAVLYPVAVDRGVLRRDGGVLVLSALVTLAIVLIGALGRIAGIVLIAMLAAYITRSYLAERQSNIARDAEEESAHTAVRNGVAVSLILAAVGLGLTLLGARFLVSSAIELATAFGISETVIGLTVVAVGTSLPELVTSVIAAVRKHTDLALGNIIGSNIFNTFAILGVTALVQPIPVPAEIIRLDIWIMLAATVGLIAFAYTARRIERWEGAVFLLAYAGYIGWLGLSAL